MANETISPNDIAIVGMALRVPGAKNVREFWDNLCNGVESIRTLSREELIEAGESPDRIHNPNYVPRAADLDEMEQFDADFFGLSPKEAAIMDPQHRQFLECAWEAMEDAGRTPDASAGPVGVFAGCGMGSYFYFNVCSNRQLLEDTGMFLLRHTGNDKDFLSTRASFTFDLRGPSVNVQTACSTSLVGVHYACQSLMSGECDMALAGGVTIELPHRRGYTFQDGEILSPDGHCRAFDHRAAGTVFGSGVAIVALRRLSDAIADGDVIHAVIKASAINNDGGTKAGYLAPSVSGQAEAIVEAQVLSGLDVDTIGYVECHGTGTYLGDPIEVEALTQAFRQGTDKTGFCRIGSVKTNIGHLDTAAGVVGLIKAALVVKHAMVPPSLNYEKPNPSIPFADSPFVVNDRLNAWTDLGAPRRAAVNSLGVGGTNAHVILEQAPAGYGGGRPDTADNDNAPRLLVFSARNRKALDGAVARLSARLKQDASLSLADTAFTLATGRKTFEHRRVVAVRGRGDAIEVLGDAETRRAFTHTTLDTPSGAVFLFPGGGAQHTGMAARLYAEDAAFRATVEEGLAALAPEAAREIRAAWLEAPAGDAKAAEALLKPSVQLPAILIIEIAVGRHLMAHGIQPQALIGHSMGENAAACLAGVFSFADAVRLVRLRGELFDTIAPGGMLSVPMDPAALKARLPEALDLASVNAPQFCVVSGLNEDLEAFRQSLAADGIDATRVPIDIAAHSRMLDAILPRFEAFLRTIRLGAPRIPIVSNLTGTWLTDAEATDPLYWCRHLRSTVQFALGMGLLAQDKARIYVEVGPGRALSSLAKAQGSIDANQIVNALPHADEKGDDRLSLMAALGRLWATGLSGDFDRLWTAPGARRVSLPTYAFQHRRYFIEAAAREQQGPEAPALVRRDDLSQWGYRPVWKRSVADIESDGEMVKRFWLIFEDDAGIGAGVTERLRALGHRVATVRQGDNFGKRGSDSYVLCPEGDRSGYDALFSGLAADGELPTEIIHLWLLTQGERHRPGSSFFHRNQECGFYSLLHLSQAMADAGIAAPLHLTVATNGMQRVGDEALPYPDKATVLGPCQVLPKEMPGVTVRVVDFDLPHAAAGAEKRRGLFVRGKAEVQTPSGTTPDDLWNELLGAPASEIVAWRKGQRWSRSHAALKLPETGEVPYRTGGVYLFTGGHGDLALALAGQLVERHAARIALVGRRPLPSREEWPSLKHALPRGDRLRKLIEAVEAMEAAGGDVLCLSADVGNQEAMTAAVEETRRAFGRIDGVFHAAGLVKDDLIPLKTHMDVEEVFSPKVLGTNVLANVLDRETLDFLVLFSSTSTDTAPAGQVDYVAANAYLNAFAEAERRRTGRKTVAVHWGIWDETGLAARAMGRARADSAGQPVRHGPFFERWEADANGVDWLERTISPERDWLLSEHRLTSGTALLPGTGYIELIAEAAREYGLPSRLTLSDLVFLRPLDVADGAEKIVRTRLEKRKDGWRATILAATAGTAWQRHAEASVGFGGAEAGLLDVRSAFERCPDRRAAPEGGSLVAAQEGHVRFGPRWRVLKQLGLGQGEALAELTLAPEACGDAMLLHPALMDIATGCAMELIPGYGETDVLWAPASYGRIEVHGPLPRQIYSHLRLADAGDLGDGYAAFDVTLAGPDGVAVVEIERFIIKRLASDTGFAGAEAPAPLAPSASPALSPAVAALAAQVAQGIRPAEGFQLLQRALATQETQPIISSIDLHALIARAAQPAAEPARPAQLFERPASERDYVAPRNSVERRLAAFWRELLGIEEIGVDDSFFDMGGHSLIAVRLFRMIRQEYGVDFPISVLFEAPTIAACARLIAERTGISEEGDEAAAASSTEAAPAARMTHLVAMHPGRDPKATPFFLCAGMFGNILNLRHLALHLGADRPVYGLQARGLYGMEAPHETFEAAAADILAEIRMVQPHGPYLLGGFSGGGITAFEIARQLTEAGETVERLIMLDTPLPTQPAISQLDRFDMKLQDIRRNKLSFVSQWWRNRMLWEKEKRERESAAAGETGGEQFHNHNIEAAFRRALELYNVRPYGGTVHLFRPVPDVVYRLRDGRRLQEGRTIVLDDNGWTPHVDELVVSIVPGDHDGMVLEPCVRVLAQRMRQCLAEAEAARGDDDGMLMAAE
ncbi:SDR family NAD(P)-dependent oxidoreductase [Aureimonas altamirensis]|uniref:type I polyketide synthase n=1 Tax=Aureimonas altamirensis TaxID=370622 RepID=UPI002036C1D0|nr:type I polyketide synthase [Aureimonas altamirensis]MCM2503049.1 SDR family NAD(P)-dependent oxidoreductase [Aureimonas altamirensis]